MDLGGKPYGYTPFCTSREETLGFQFWRSGYWKEHLRGKPYHISALYVFRNPCLLSSLLPAAHAATKSAMTMNNLGDQHCSIAE